MEEKSFASELLHEIKQSAHRWFIIAMSELLVILILMGSMIWYFSLPVESYDVSVQNDGGNTNYVGANLNGVINNGEDNSKVQEENGTE